MFFNNWGHFIYVIFILHFYFVIIKVTQMVKNLTSIQETQVRSLGWEDALRRECLPALYCCLENSTDRGAWGYSPGGCKASDTTEQLTHTLQSEFESVSFLQKSLNLTAFSYFVTLSFLSIFNNITMFCDVSIC